MMPVFVKGDDFRGGLKAYTHHSQLQLAQVSMGWVTAHDFMKTSCDG